jgi:serine/threonine protein kinase
MSAQLRQLGKYTLQERLARGGQGEVWKAFDTQLRRYVAIKQLLANLQFDPDFVSRFEREARFIASLHHPNIVQIHDFQVIQDPDSDTSTAYMVMDFIEGPTLADYIRNTSRKLQFPAPTDLVYIFTQVSLALDYAHGKGMVHRDIKPANILLDQRPPKRNPLGSPILTDFGIARLQGVSAEKTQVLGTPLYVSPEQAQWLPVDKRSDLYSLGIILYEMTTGVTPFRGDSLMAILMQHYQDTPPPPALINPAIPPALSEAILKSIAKDPDARFQSASAMTIAIAESLNVPVPSELTKPAATRKINGTNPVNPLSRPLGMTPAAPLVQSSSPAAFSPLANDDPTFLINRADSPAIALPSNPATNIPVASTQQQTQQASPPTALPPVAPPRPSRQRKPLYIALFALLAALLIGSGLLATFFALHKTTTPTPVTTVLGHVLFLSSPAARPGTIDEVEITLQGMRSLPSGEQYYAWLQIHSEDLTPIGWPLTPHNGSLSSFPYIDPQHRSLLTPQPYLLLITTEAAGTAPKTPNFDPSARLYYAILQPPIQNQSTFTILKCPQSSSNNICFS